MACNTRFCMHTLVSIFDFDVPIAPQNAYPVDSYRATHSLSLVDRPSVGLRPRRRRWRRGRRRRARAAAEFELSRSLIRHTRKLRLWLHEIRAVFSVVNSLLIMWTKNVHQAGCIGKEVVKIPARRCGVGLYIAISLKFTMSLRTGKSLKRGVIAFSKICSTSILMRPLQGIRGSTLPTSFSERHVKV